MKTTHAKSKKLFYCLLFFTRQNKRGAKGTERKERLKSRNSDGAVMVDFLISQHRLFFLGGETIFVSGWILEGTARPARPWPGFLIIFLFFI